ncbi:UvrD-helicase domain-containing protein [Acinetobacter pittii]|uniref:UvrD-helicase domain-containing protein n=1 Tax=Acinetobacter pittii TaxID=48296 RepID=UPI0032616CD1
MGEKKTIVNNSSSFYPRLASYIEDDIILKILEKGYLTFSHCYDFAEEYLQSYPDIVNIISARFKYIFIDETQDTNERQFKLLDTLFGNSDSIVQKIGDNDQSIFNFESKDIETWDIGDNYIKINNTKRLSQKICKVASDFSITNYRLESESQIDIHPIIIVFDDERINEVLPVFAAKIKLYNLDLIDNSFFKAIGGVSQRKVKHTIPSYIDYHRKESLEEVDENNLKDKLLKSKCDLTPYFINNIYWEIILQYLDILNIRNEVGKYTKNSLSNYLKINQKKLLDQLKLNSIYMVDSIFSESDPFLYLEKSIIDLADFMEFSYDCNTLKSIIFNHKVGNPKKNSDKVTINIDGSDIDIHISTIHKSKGETHTATLVMETYNRAYDFNQLLPLLKGKKLNKFSAKKKLLYVGMTRPTHLLCLALHKSYLKSSGNRVTLNESDFEQMKLNGFEVIVLD